MKKRISSRRDITLLFELGCLRFMPRSWKRFQNPDVANNAEHIFRVAWIAWVLAKYEGNKNSDKIVKMALAHDVSESRTGDVDHLSKNYTKRDEPRAVADIVCDTVLDEEVLALMREYEERKSPESKIVKDADTLDVDLEIMEQRARGHLFGTLWNKRRRGFIYPKLYTKSARKLWKEIYQSRVDDWFTDSLNSFDGNNWKWKK